MSTEKRNSGSLHRLLQAAVALGPRDWVVSEIADAAGVEITAARSMIAEVARSGDGRVTCVHRGGGRHGISRYRIGSADMAAEPRCDASGILRDLLQKQYRLGVRMVNQVSLRAIVRSAGLSDESVRSAMRRMTDRGTMVRHAGTVLADTPHGYRHVTQWELLGPLVGQEDQHQQTVLGASVALEQAWQALVVMMPILRDLRPHPQPDLAAASVRTLIETRETPGTARRSVLVMHREDADDAPSRVYTALAALARHNQRVQNYALNRRWPAFTYRGGRRHG